MTTTLTSFQSYFLLPIFILSAVVTALLAVSSHIPLAGFIARSILYLVCLSVCATYGVFASIFLRAVGYGGLSQWTVARAFKWTMWLTTGIEFDIQNEEHLQTRPAVFIGNHQTELDILVLGTVFPRYCSVTAKKSLRFMPILGWFMVLSKTVFIDRGNRESAKMAFDAAAKQMKTEKQSVYIFPEGTRSYASEPKLLPFKKGAFHLAIQAQVPIVPIVVANYSNVFHFQTRTFTSGKIPVKVLPPIPTTDMTAENVDELVKSTRESMLEELVQLTKTSNRQAIAMAASKTTESVGTSAVKATGFQKQS